MKNKVLMMMLITSLLMLVGCQKKPNILRPGFNDSLNNIRSLVIIDNEYKGKTIDSWESSNPSVITIIKREDGQYRTSVIRSSEDQKVTLTATVGKQTYSYNLTVKALTGNAFYDLYPSINDDKHIFNINSYDEIVEKLSSGTHIIYFGFPACPWCVEYVYYYNKIGKEKGIEAFEYFDHRLIRTVENGVLNEKFETITNLLGADNVVMHEVDGIQYPWIYAPTVYVIKDGEVLGKGGTAFNGHIARLGALDKKSYDTFKKELETLFNIYLNALK